MNSMDKPWHASAVAIITTSLSGGAFGAQPDGYPPAVPQAALASTQPVPNWSSALEGAWKRSIEAAEATGQHRRALAEQAGANAWLSAPPAVELAQRQGQGATARGQRETEVGLVLPLWRWGQRDAATLSASADAAFAVAQERAARLRLAGRVRDAAGALLTQEEEVQLARAQSSLLQRLSSDVERRVAAGDLAPADGWAARAEWLAAQSQLSAQERQFQSARSQWHLLTGLAATPAWPTQGERVQPPEDALTSHPEFALASHAAERARRRLELTQASRGEAPELSIGVRDERPGPGDPTQRSVALSLRLPLGGTAHSQPRLAAALAELEVALTTEQRTRDRLGAELAVTRQQEQSTLAQAEFERQRAALLRERSHHLQKSFDAGELALPELLRALIAAAEAESASARQRIAAGLARMRVQHALGIIQ